MVLMTLKVIDGGGNGGGESRWWILGNGMGERGGRHLLFSLFPFNIFLPFLMN